MTKKPNGSATCWAIVMEGGTRIEAEQVRCLLAARGLHPLRLTRQVPWARLTAFSVRTGGCVIVPPDEADAARDLLRDAGFLKGDLPMSRIEPRPAKMKSGRGRACGYCDAPADADAAYCDQCAQPLR